MDKLKKYLKKQKAARELFRATCNYNGFKNLETAPRGLKKLCFYYSEVGFESDTAMRDMTCSSKRSLYLETIEYYQGIVERVYKQGGVFSSYADYLSVRNYLEILKEFVEKFPLTWAWTYRLHL